MKAFSLVLAEAWHRRGSSMLGALAVALAVSLVHFFLATARATEHETRLIQRDIGLNVVILSEEVAVDDYWARGWAEATIPASYLERLAGQQVANRLVPMLRRRLAWGGVDVLLTGMAQEILQEGQKRKPVFGWTIEPGTLVLGGRVAEALELGDGAEAELLGERFRVASVLPPSGSEEDVVVYANLGDVQRLLGLEGRVNEIQALECHCSDDVDDPLAVLRAELEPLLPGTQVLRRRSLAEARRKQRELAERWLGLATPVSLLLCGLWIGALAALNVRERREEIGVLRALGWSGGRVAGVVLGRAVVLGALGAALGALGGRFLAGELGPQVFELGRASLALDPTHVALSFFLAPAFAALASLVPAALAMTADPMDSLRQR